MRASCLLTWGAQRRRQKWFLADQSQTGQRHGQSGARQSHQDHHREGAPGLRSARAADRGDGAPGRDLRLRPLPLRDAGGVPGRGERAGAIWRAPASGGGHLNVQQLIPEDRVAQTLSDLFGAVRFCPDTLADWVEKKARAFEPVFARIAALASAAPVRCLDETGFRVAGRGHWLHTVATDTLTLYRVSPKRGDIPKDLIGGVIVHDGSSSGSKASARALQRHHLRELMALIEFDKEHGRTMRDLLLEANRAVDEARQRGKPPRSRLAKTSTVAIGKSSSWAFLSPRLRASATGLQRGPGQTPAGHNLLIRLHKSKTTFCASLRLRVLHQQPREQACA